MAIDPRKRQKKLQKRSAKRKEKRHTLVREQSLGIFHRQLAFANCPILHCAITNSFAQRGNGSVIFSRESATRQVAVNAFLVDSYCLGVKDIASGIMTRTQYDERFTRKLNTDMPSHTVSPAEALKFLEAAVAYARSLGLEPYEDYEQAIRLFGDADPAASDAQFTFGKDGKPFFIAGPYDTPARCEMIMSILNKTVGPNNFHYTIPIAPSTELHLLPDSLDGYEMTEDYEFENLENDEEGGEMPRKSR